MSDPLAFSWPLRVYWEDTDAGGVVYHASYLRLIERARSEWLRGLGVVQSELKRQADRIFAVSSAQLDFLSPARLDDELQASVELIELRGASLLFAQQLIRPADATLLLRARIRAVCLRGSDFRPAPIPSELAAMLRPVCQTTRNKLSAE